MIWVVFFNEEEEYEGFLEFCSVFLMCFEVNLLLFWIGYGDYGEFVCVIWCCSVVFVVEVLRLVIVFCECGLFGG